MYRRVFADYQSSTAGGHTLERDFITNGYINQPIVTWQMGQYFQTFLSW